MTLDALRSKAVFLLLIIATIVYAFCVGSLCCNVVLSVLSSLVFNNLVEDERVGCFTLIYHMASCLGVK